MIAHDIDKDFLRASALTGRHRPCSGRSSDWTQLLAELWSLISVVHHLEEKVMAIHS